MKIITAKSAGFCFGIERAVNICRQAVRQYQSCITLGPITHNNSVIEQLKNEGVSVASGIREIMPGSTVIIRSHGAGEDDWRYLKSLGVNIIDATCPNVSKIHKVVKSEEKDSRQVLIVGDKTHPEILAISNHCQDCVVLEDENELSDWLKTADNRQKPISVVFQTTSRETVYKSCEQIIKKECTNYKMFDTICNATCERQRESAELAGIADACVVIGGRNSANSIKLAEICKEKCENVFFAETASELNIKELCKFKTIAVTAGASTPAWIIKEVNQKMSEENMINTVNEEDSARIADEQTSTQEEVVETFEEMLEKSIKTLHTGERVKGVVALITPTEVSVDLGIKQSGYIPISELTDDPNEKIEDIIKVGDVIETFVMRVNDVEGMVMLSKKRLDMIKSWDDIELARENKTVVEGVVTEENKGGIVVSVKGVRVFVPASQTGLPRDADMSVMLKKNVRLRITEINGSRRRVVGSIRAVTFEERQQKAEQVWNEIEAGKKYTGIVKSMTSYGVFVDIGGVDGMVHISELSWTRIGKPSDVVAVGDELNVFVLSFDKEKKKISLGCKNPADNPWTKFITNYSIGDVVNVKIVKMMPFGAFAEIIAGVDGLIHISQITDHRVGLPSEILSDGQLVDVKITDIDIERKKVSLSIRALIAPDSMTSANSEQRRVEDNTPSIVYDTDSPPADL